MDEDLTNLALRHARNGNRVPMARVGLYSTDVPGLPVPALYPPMLCIILQGKKEVAIGSRLLHYDTASYLLGSLQVPAEGRIVEASVEEPYVAASLEIDSGLLAELVAERLLDAGRSDDGEMFGFGVSHMTPELEDAWTRLLRLLDSPQDIPVLAPMIEREILYRILQGPQGHLLRQIASADSRLAQVRNSIDHLRRNFDRHVRMDDLAAVAGMSSATFNRHFRAATAMSPLQFQKALRLQEARRRMIADADAARAGHGVGYESISQFSREYARMFGAPPARDAARLRQLRPEDKYELSLVTAT